MDVALDAGDETLVVLVAECDMAKVRLRASGSVAALLVQGILVGGQEQLIEIEPMPLSCWRAEAPCFSEGMQLGERCVLRVKNPTMRRQEARVWLEGV